MKLNTIGCLGSAILCASFALNTESLASIIVPGGGLQCTTTITLCDGETRTASWTCEEGQCCVIKQYENFGTPSQCISHFIVGCDKNRDGWCTSAA